MTDRDDDMLKDDGRDSPDFWADLRRFAARVPFLDRLVDDSPRVAVIRMSGVISDGGNGRKPAICHHRFARSIDKAFGKTPFGAVALVINSPGGMPAQASLISSHIRRLAEEKDRPVYAFVEDIAASGGYWLACAADKVYAQETSIVGSIGVISASFGFEDLIERHGVSRRVHTSGEYKSFMDPFLPEKQEDVRRLRLLQEDIHERFTDWVKERRGDTLKGSDRSLFEGQFWTGRTALEQGVIDGIGDLRGIMREKFGEKVRLVDLSPERPLFPLPFQVPLRGGAQGWSGSLAEDVIDALESRAIWGRYGL